VPFLRLVAVSQHSIINTRLFLWINACEAWGFDEIVPLFDERGLAERAPGEVSFCASRDAVIDGRSVRVTLSVSEAWLPGDDPEGDHRLRAEGCHVPRLNWHLQVGAIAGDRGAERLDVGPEDDKHPRIHRHPYGQPNEIREPTELPPPDAWLHHANQVLGEALDDGLQDWDDLADKEE